jgi:hypothetical protein
MPYKLCLAGLITAILVVCAPWAMAGGGPENVFLVINPDSPDSMAIGNHYVQLRHIPPGNVIYVPWSPPNLDGTNIEPFREQILRPVLEAIDSRKLVGQIDYIVYSSNYPGLIKFHEEIPKFVDEASKSFGKPSPWPQILGSQASLTGLTYLYSPVMAKSPGYASLASNRYMRLVVGDEQVAPTMGFRGDLQFDESGRVVPSGGERYLLSTMLAAMPTEKLHGISAEEALAYLSRSVQADGSQPKGTIYFTQTSDVRTIQRSKGYAFAQTKLRELGIPAEIIPSSMPFERNDVLGLTSGAEKFSWSETRSKILPGALCDNLTSYGGLMLLMHSQTVLTEFLRYGAAGASGTVVEPYLILAKFPSPMLHVHYARGCSLAEAFYQSIHAPYQQLIIGDALCQPFARIPRVSVPDIKPGQKIRGVLALRPEATIPPKTPADKEPAGVTLPGGPSDEQVDHFELFVDGVRDSVAKPGEPLSLDTAKLADGYHELRIVAVGPSPIATQGREIVWIVADNHGRTITATTPSNKTSLDGTLSVTAQSSGAKRIEVRHNGRTLGTISGGSGSTTLKAAQLGKGFAYLQVVGIHGEAPAEQAFARPIVLWVE